MSSSDARDPGAAGGSPGQGHPVSLLLQHAPRRLIPLNQRGLTRTQKSKAALTREHAGSELLLPTGELFPITGFDLGKSTDLGLPWPFEWATFSGERFLTVHFGAPKRPPFSEIKDLILGFLRDERHHEDWVDEESQWPAFLAKVQAASNVEVLFRALKLEGSEAGLDVFS